jgi:hypothetical protein
MADAKKAEPAGSQGSRAKSWYDGEKAKGNTDAKGGTSDTPDEPAEHPMKREMRAAMERHGKERDDMLKRHGEEMNGLLDREDLVNAQVPVAGDKSMA